MVVFKGKKHEDSICDQKEEIECLREIKDRQDELIMTDRALEDQIKAISSFENDLGKRVRQGVPSKQEPEEKTQTPHPMLQAGIFTKDVKAALRAARELEFGGVTINEAPTFRADQMPYGGVKDSGNTREGPHYAVRELTEERLVTFQG